MQVTINIGQVGDADCSLILSHGEEYWEFLVESAGWNALPDPGEAEISIKEFHSLLKLWRASERKCSWADAS